MRYLIMNLYSGDVKQTTAEPSEQECEDDDLIHIRINGDEIHEWYDDAWREVSEQP